MNRQAVIDTLKENVTEQFGTRCPDYCDTCFVCRIWDLMDELENKEGAGTKHLKKVEKALEYSMAHLAYPADLENVEKILFDEE